MKMNSIGENIRKYRKARNLRQEDLAEKAGLSVNYIGMVERGEKTPSLETFITIINCIGVSADMVLCDVLDVGYTVKSSLLNERLSRVAASDREKIYAVIETMLSHSKINHK